MQEESLLPPGCNSKHGCWRSEMEAINQRKESAGWASAAPAAATATANLLPRRRESAGPLLECCSLPVCCCPWVVSCGGAPLGAGDAVAARRRRADARWPSGSVVARLWALGLHSGTTTSGRVGSSLKLNVAPRRVKLLLADDLVASSESAVGLQLFMRQFEATCDQWGLTGSSKPECMGAGARRQLSAERRPSST